MTAQAEITAALSGLLAIYIIQAALTSAPAPSGSPPSLPGVLGRDQTALLAIQLVV